MLQVDEWKNNWVSTLIQNQQAYHRHHRRRLPSFLSAFRLHMQFIVPPKQLTIFRFRINRAKIACNKQQLCIIGDIHPTEVRQWNGPLGVQDGFHSIGVNGHDVYKKRLL